MAVLYGSDVYLLFLKQCLKQHMTLVQVMKRVRANADTGADTFASVIKKAVLFMAPSLLHAQQQLSTARMTTQAVLDGTCVYLFAGMLCHLINVN